MSAKKSTIPFCPNCGGKEFVTKLSIYSETWKCELCKIKFNFSEFPKTNIPLNIDADEYQNRLLDPAKIWENWPVLGPARKIFFEQEENKIRITSDLDSFKSFLASPEIKSMLPESLGKKRCNQLGHIDLDKGTIDSMDFDL